MARALFALAAFICLPLTALAEDWPAWRGPEGDGRSTARDLLAKWDRTTNVRWKVPLPEEGNSSPIVWNNRVFLTQAINHGRRRAVLCFDRADGKLLWQKETPYEDKEETHATNPYCSASPVTDGERVIASLGSAGLVCYDFLGKQLWHKDVGALDHIWGNASSPILYEDLAILWCGPGRRQFLLAVDKSSGRTVWEHDEPGGNRGDDPSKWRGSWSTPIVIKVVDHDELILGVPDKLKAFDPRTGKELWSCAGLGPLVYTSPVQADGIVVAMSGYHGPAMAVRAGGRGDVTATHRLWRQTDGIPQRIGSPVIVGEHVYMVNEPGTAQCFELKTGKELWGKERVGDNPWGSLVAADGKLYVTDHSGTTIVLAADPKFKVIAKNPLNEPVRASAAVSNGEIFIRTYKHLWCIGSK
jgi:outer membrane protein assembly factor BamB